MAKEKLYSGLPGEIQGPANLSSATPENARKLVKWARELPAYRYYRRFGDVVPHFSAGRYVLLVGAAAALGAYGYIHHRNQKRYQAELDKTQISKLKTEEKEKH